ncbi:GNAT family N-acetyltransferase [Microbulbifer zhoushanensis]|uniref:GNAT family N-acetyltransferase n=1 Tax=Microbulbifer TaxID=48073 RepID=UPI001F259B08|nr:GNAT family N-acetyltransferase [Microbulbifer zhoushanensis]
MVIEKDISRVFGIRQAEGKDVPVLIQFLANLALHVNGGPPQNLKQEEQDRLAESLRTGLADPDCLLLVAETSGAKLVGMGYLSIVRNHGIWEGAGNLELTVGVIDDVWVEPDFRNMGVFSALMGELVAFADAQGVRELMLEYSTSNREAEAAWGGLGFKPTGVRAAAPTETVRQALSRR